MSKLNLIKDKLKECLDDIPKQYTDDLVVSRELIEYLFTINKKFTWNYDITYVIKAIYNSFTHFYQERYPDYKIIEETEICILVKGIETSSINKVEYLLQQLQKYEECDKKYIYVFLIVLYICYSVL